MTAAPPKQQTLDQRRAAHAWNAVRRVKALSEQDQKDYGREAKDLPARIHAAGLGHALAFLHAKGKIKLNDEAEGKAGKAGKKTPEDKEKAGFKQLIADVNDWVIRDRGLRAGARGCLMESIIKGDALFLRHAAEETLAYLAWLVRFADAEGLTKDSESES